MNIGPARPIDGCIDEDDGKYLLGAGSTQRSGVGLELAEATCHGVLFSSEATCHGVLFSCCAGNEATTVRASAGACFSRRASGRFVRCPRDGKGTKPQHPSRTQRAKIFTHPSRPRFPTHPPTNHVPRVPRPRPARTDQRTEAAHGVIKTISYTEPMFSYCTCTCFITCRPARRPSPGTVARPSAAQRQRHYRPGRLASRVTCLPCVLVRRGRGDAEKQSQ
jgi:hypothetical protein